MAYCTITDLQLFNSKRTYSATTTPTTAQVNSIIDQVAAEIDMALSIQGYTVPVTTPTAMTNFLKFLNALGAAAYTEDSMFPETAETGEKAATTHSSKLMSRFKDWLKKLEEGKVPKDVPRSASALCGFSDYTQDSDQDNYPDPAFAMSPTVKEF